MNSSRRSSEAKGAKRLFRITAEGEKCLDDNEAAPPVELLHAMQALKASLLFHRGGWDAKELARVSGPRTRSRRMIDTPRVMRVRHELRRRSLAVARIEAVAPGMRRAVRACLRTERGYTKGWIKAADSPRVPGQLRDRGE